MRISHIRIQNVLGIDQLEFSPEGFTTISGRNGAGKTSVLEAIKAVVKGGHDATLLRKGAKEGEIVLVLDDGTEARKRVTETNSTLDVKQGGKKVAKPQAAIQALTDMLSVNPVEFLNAPAKDRVRVLLESMPLQVDTARLSGIVGWIEQPRPGEHGLHTLDRVHKQVYDARTGTNRAVKEKSGTISQLRQALPPEGAGVEGDEGELQAKLDEINGALEAEKARIDNKLAGLRAEKDAKVQEKREAIAKLQEEINQLNADFIAIEGKANTQRQKAIEKNGTDSAPVKAALQRIRDDRESYARRQQTLDTIASLETELESLEEEAAKQTKALCDIESYKLELLGSLPIEGLEVRDGELFRDGVPFDRLNTAQQVDIAVEIAKVRAGELGVVCVDGLELLDNAFFEEFKARAEVSELQFFVTKVTDDEMSIQ
jgi:hypothetical protein